MANESDKGMALKGFLSGFLGLPESVAWYLDFGPDLERRFAADVFAYRARQFRFFGTLGPLLFSLFYFDDLTVAPDIPILSACVRLGMPVIALIFLFLVVMPRRMLLYQEIGTSIVVALASLGQVLIFYNTGVTDKVTVLNGIYIYVLYGAVCMPMRFKVALPAVLSTTAVICAVIAISSLDRQARVDQIATILMLMLITLLLSYRLDVQSRLEYLQRLREAELSEELVSLNKALRDLSEQDGLTGLLNRRAIGGAMETAYAAAFNAGLALGVIMVDVDHFKAYNDHYGHPCGDECLRTVARVLSDNIRRDKDILGRYGGEEFVVLLPDADLAEGIRIAERIRHALLAEKLPHEGFQAGLQRYVTISLGVAAVSSGEPVPLHQLIHMADRELYNAKRAGRNRVSPSGGGTAGDVVEFSLGV